MSEAWYNELPESEEDRLYSESVKRIQSAVLQGMMSFESASGLIDVKDEALRAQILSDALKVLLAQLHFKDGTPLEALAKKLGLPVKRLEEAKNSMLEEVKEAAVERYRKESGL
ncbi:MAG: hypothetical protein M0Z48_05180 [Nitrospiraceae bacterium]|nr:hypothetical protein [Nitrospiraceae bacterium]